jgi:ribosome biogenesis SPOUT family RNA methylase Rps3
MKFVIEHLEPDVFDWCLIEYNHISSIVGKENLIFTNVKKGKEKLKGLGEVKGESVSKLNLKNACVLDPEAEKTLNPADKKFDYLIFGGILGDYPPRKRTKVELSSKLKCEIRNLGKEQMATNTAVYVAKKIIDGKNLNEFEFKDEIKIDIKEGESVILPFRYVIENGEIVLAKGFIEFLKKRKGF